MSDLPSAGSITVLQSATISLDPGATLGAPLELDGTTTLEDNGGGFVIGSIASALALGTDALYADGAIVNQGAIGVANNLTIIVDNGPTTPYGLLEPSFENLGAVAIGPNGTLNITGTEFSNQGNVDIDGGTLIVSGGGVDGGQVTLSPTASSPALTSLALALLGDAVGPLPSLSTAQSIPQDGTIGITNHGTAWFGGAVSNQAIYFAGDGTVYFGDPGQISNVTINNFSAGDTIVTDNPADAQALLNALTFTGATAAITAPDLILEAVAPCFARGTRLLTPLGYVPVETLKPGDPIVTAKGDTRPVRWVGHCIVDLCAHSRPAAVQPIKFTQGSLAPGLPAQTLRLSPDHGLYLRNALVPAKLLANGATIIRETNATAITYYHVELDRHDLLLAEGVAVESYLDTGNRSAFTRASGSPVFGRSKNWDHAAYAPLCLNGPILRDIRQDIRIRTADLGYRRRTLTDVTLLADGQRITRTHGEAAQPIFHFPTPFTGQITIQSPRFIPAELSLGQHDEDDNRVLGIAISRINLGSRLVAARQIARAGFYPRAAQDRADWTDGNGVIEVPEPIAALALNIAALPLGWIRS
jgi:hypothetical protein